MEKEHLFRCHICSEALVDHSGQAECFFCKTSEEAELLCPNGHYICETCRTSTPSQVVLRVFTTNRSEDPFEIANLIMLHPSFRDSGPEHHIITAPALLTAMRNRGDKHIDGRMVQEAINRCRILPYGSCGSLGACGACLSAGCFISLIEKATYASDQERALALRTTSEALKELSELGGPRCCKQSVYSAISAAQRNIQKEDRSSGPLQVNCLFKDRVKDCKRERCPYYRG